MSSDNAAIASDSDGDHAFNASDSGFKKLAEAEIIRFPISQAQADWKRIRAKTDGPSATVIPINPAPVSK